MDGDGFDAVLLEVASAFEEAPDDLGAIPLMTNLRLDEERAFLTLHDGTFKMPKQPAPGSDEPGATDGKGSGP